MNEKTQIFLAENPNALKDLHAIRGGLQAAGLNDTLTSEWSHFLGETASQGHFDLEDLDELVAKTCQSQAPDVATCDLLLEALRLAATVRAHFPVGPWLALAQTQALVFLQAGRHNVDSRRALWELAFSALSQEIRPLFAAPDLNRLSAILHMYPFVMADEFMVPSLLSPLMDAWAAKRDLLDGLYAAYGHFPATARKYARLVAK
jgi:hypothetical protein